MASDLTTKVDFQLLHVIPDVVLMIKAAQSDIVNFTYPGVMVISGHTFTAVADTVTNVIEPFTYGTLKASAAFATVTTTTGITYDNATATRLLPYYLMNATSGEILYVTADTGAASTTGSLTVRRGALGTTAAAIADNAPFYVLNQIILGGTSVGKVTLLVMPYPVDPGVQLFKRQNSS
jgi:hypothetical protein